MLNLPTLNTHNMQFHYVCFCFVLQPLVECYTQVREKGKGVQLRLSETWYREYQVKMCKMVDCHYLHCLSECVVPFVATTDSKAYFY